VMNQKRCGQLSGVPVATSAQAPRAGASRRAATAARFID
jgi:hypothetical protein